MADLGHELRFGAFLTPSSSAPERMVELARVSEDAGLDLVTFQDHPYQPALLDAWTALTWVAAHTRRVRLAADVHNLPLRQPAVLARAVAGLDLLSGGRIELGLGAGGFWDPIVAMGGRRLSPGQAVDAVGEAIDIIRGIWDAGNRERLVVDGAHHRVAGAKRGPAPAHDIEIWVGGLRPRMLRLIGRKADGWLPTFDRMAGEAELARSNAIIDRAAVSAGRRPGDVRRLLNIAGGFTPGAGDGMFAGPPARWVDQLAGLALGHGVSTFILMSDDPAILAVFGQEVAPAVRDLVERERATGSG